MTVTWDEPPAALDCGWSELPDLIPDWVLEQGPLPEPLGCECSSHDTEPSVSDTGGPADRLAGQTDPHPATGDAGAQDVPWATPGVTGLSTPTPTPALPPVSALVAQAQTLVEQLRQIRPAGLPAVQALADGEALLAIEQQLRVLNLDRLADIGARGLHELVGARSTKSWLRQHRPDGDLGDATLAAQLREFPTLHTATRTGSIPLAAARKVVLALRKVTPHVDRRDGLIDDQPADQVLTAVVAHVLSLICRNLQGLHDHDPRLTTLITRGQQVLTSSSSQAQVLEAAFTWLAEHLPPRQLTGPLDELVVALLPSTLEDRAERGRRRAGLSLTPLDDGSGWHLSGDLSLECGERLWAALRAEAARDPRNATDTATWADATEAEKQAWRDGNDPVHHDPNSSDPTSSGDRPRAKRERLHDALNRLLARYLEHGLGGTSGKVPVQVHVTLTEPTITGRPGAPPARTDSGRLVPRGLIRRWWCDATVTTYILSMGGKALRVLHAQRTLSGDERRALTLEGGDRCVGDGCCPGQPDPLVPIRPHHIHGYAENLITTLDDTLPVCDRLHQDLHDGHKTVRLRDGRYLNEHGFVDHPDLGGTPPF